MHTDLNMSSSPQNIYSIQITEFIIINDSIYIRIYLNIYNIFLFNNFYINFKSILRQKKN